MKLLIAVAVGDQTWASASHAEVGFDGALSASIEAGDIAKSNYT